MAHTSLMSHKLGCIADDFTGATDLANNLVQRGLRAVQTIGVPPVDDALDAPAVVVALKSRTCAPYLAVQQSLAALRYLKKQDTERIYLKVCSTFDSTDKGNIGIVIDALMDEMEVDFSIVCPAFPAAGRTVYQGHLFVGDGLLSDSAMRHHPLTPMTDSNLVRVLQRQTARTVGLVNLAVVAQGAEAIRAEFARLQDAGVQIAIVDAVSDADLLALGAAAVDLPLVTAGSGLALGLAHAYSNPVPSSPSLPQATGGAVVQALGISRLNIGPQIDTGVPWCEGIRAEGAPVAITLKSGNFGSEDFFSKALGMLA